jgi:hypothetical protein
MECCSTLANKPQEGTLPIGIIEKMVCADLVRPIP